jgi:hypothetical protein
VKRRVRRYSKTPAVEPDVSILEPEAAAAEAEVEAASVPGP